MIRYAALFDPLASKRLTMADLRYALHREEFEDVETVVSSDNVLFSFDERPSDGLEDLIAHMMHDRFDFDSFVAVRTAAEIDAAIAANPFHEGGGGAFVQTHFLARQPSQAQFDAMVDAHRGRGEERFALGRRTLFVNPGLGKVQSKLTPAFVARRLGSESTVRDMAELARIREKLLEGGRRGS